ncbi:MAG: hypothetical protein HYY10_02005 [Candidatus Liptonbacteria bacterium]|nr:hypothetical protein [Candidatus Liptonbacteria bacterium]
MKLSIGNKVFEKFQGLHIGVVVAKEVNNAGGALAEVEGKLRGEEERIRASYQAEALPQDPKIDVWRKAYAAFGAKPKEHESSVENLYRLVLGGGNLRHINNLVDVYNFISLKHMLPVGGEDINAMRGDVVLTFAGANEPPALLLGDKEPRTPHAGEVIYKDEVGALCRRWNWREAARTKLTESTKNAVLVIEGLPPVGRGEVDAAAKELKELVEQYCGGQCAYEVLEKENPEMAV